ncbi:MAG: sigma-70 family RNA polymerase sigma factor [Leadbetterella sp.]|nr:sigma-70 family RNA polymerase sigma factor [Leadbetterella sp.]
MSKTESFEQKLLQRLTLKESSAWKELYETYSGNMTYVCKRYIKEPEDVRDVLQNSFVKMFHAINSFEFRGEGSVRAWMTRIVVNEALKHLRNNSRMEFAPPPEDFPDPADTEEPDVEEIPHAAILEMIRLLPDGYRLVLIFLSLKRKVTGK